MNDIIINNVGTVIGKQFFVKIPIDKIEKAGIDIIKQWLVQNEFPIPGDTFTWDWMTIRGTLVKRLAVFCRKEGKPLDQKQITEIGRLAKEQFGNGQSYYFDIVAPPFKWRDGQFGKSQSCWRSGSTLNTPLDNIEGMYAARFYENNSFSIEEGNGRTWIYQIPNHNLFVSFNGYMHDKDRGFTPELARAISTCFNLYARPIYTTATRGDDLWINSRLGYIMGIEEDVLAYCNKNKIGDLAACTIQLNTYVNCEKCGIRLLTHEATASLNGWICGICLVFYTKCSLCDVETQFQEILVHENLFYCMQCFSGVWFWCGGCRKIISTIYRKDKCCEDCYDKYYTACTYCGVTFAKGALGLFKPSKCTLCGENEEDISIPGEFCNRCLGLINQNPPYYANRMELR